jgi:ABC-type sugar transport system permease subunit
MAKQAQTARLEGSRWTPYLFVAPVAVYLLVFQGYPLLQELILSFTSTSLLSPSEHAVVGVRNYGDLVGTTDFICLLSRRSIRLRAWSCRSDWAWFPHCFSMDRFQVEDSRGRWSRFRGRRRRWPWR